MRNLFRELASVYKVEEEKYILGSFMPGRLPVPSMARNTVLKLGFG